MRQVEAALRNVLQKSIVAMGYEFVGAELLGGGRQALLRIYIDSKLGVTVDDCARVSRQMSAMLDVEDLIQGRYILEVSSPGLNRRLFEVADFVKYIGHSVKLRLARSSTEDDERRNIVGTLLKVEGTDLYMQVGTEEKVISFSAIEKANLVVEI